MPSLTVEERQARVDEITARLKEIDAEHSGEALPEAHRHEFESLAAERKDHEHVIAELEARKGFLADEAERHPERQVSGDGAAFQTARPRSVRGEDIWDLSTVRGSAASPEQMTRELRDRAMQAIERAQFPHPKANKEDAQAEVEHLLTYKETKDGKVARHLLATGSPAYHRAFGKTLAGERVSEYEGAALQAALSVGSDSAGGFAVPFQLDPTIINTSDGSVNPYRAISRVETLVGTNEWKGVSAADVTATRRAEAAEVGDNSPTLGQPSVKVERVDAFVPFSIEVGQDWNGLQSEMARLIQRAKDNEEAESFTDGDGASPNAEGVITGATTVVETGAARAFAVGDVYAVEEALGSDFGSRARWVGHRSIYNLIRQFDTQGGAQLWIDNLRVGLDRQVPTPGGIGATLLGYPAHECSAMDSSIDQAGNAILVLGDFEHFLIAERLGMTIEVVPHLFATANNRPSGQRGLLAYWRNNSAVLAANAFRVLQVSSGS